MSPLKCIKSNFNCTHLKQIERNSGNVTDPKDEDNADEDGGNTLISSWSPRLWAETVSFGWLWENTVNVTIENTEEKERKKDHDDKISNKNVVPAVAELLSKTGGAHTGLAAAAVA